MTSITNKSLQPSLPLPPRKKNRSRAGLIRRADAGGGGGSPPPPSPPQPRPPAPHSPTATLSNPTQPNPTQATDAVRADLRPPQGEARRDGGEVDQPVQARQAPRSWELWQGRPLRDPVPSRGRQGKTLSSPPLYSSRSFRSVRDHRAGNDETAMIVHSSYEVGLSGAVLPRGPGTPAMTTKNFILKLVFHPYLSRPTRASLDFCLSTWSSSSAAPKT